MQKNHTHIVLDATEGEGAAVYNLEKKVIDGFSVLKDVFTYGMFDCCREELSPEMIEQATRGSGMNGQSDEEEESKAEK